MSHLAVFILILVNQVDDPLGAVLGERRKIERGEFEFSCSTWKTGMAKDSPLTADLNVWFDGKSNKTDLVVNANAEQYHRETSITNGSSAKYFYVVVPADGSHITGAAFGDEAHQSMKRVRNFDPRSLGLTFTSPVSQMQHPFDALLSQPFVLKSEKEVGDRIICQFAGAKSGFECHLAKARRTRVLFLKKTVGNSEFQVSIDFPKDGSGIDYPEKAVYVEKRNGAVFSKTEVVVRRVSANKAVPLDLFSAERAGLKIGQSISFEAKAVRGNPIYFWDGKRFWPDQEYQDRIKKDKKKIALLIANQR